MPSSKVAARALNVLGDVHLDIFHAMDFGSSEHTEERVYEVYIRSGLNWSAVSLRTGATSYKWLVQASLIFSAFPVSFLELLWVYSSNVEPWLTAKMSVPLMVEFLTTVSKQRTKKIFLHFICIPFL